MEIPKIMFTKWYKWEDRNSIENLDSPGLYILAKFKNVPKGIANISDKNIIYIGETCNQILKRRLYQFNNSAFKQKDGHSGGWSYSDSYHDSGKDLYLAVLPVTNSLNNLRHLFIRHVERKLMFDFALTHGHQPRLNKK